MIWEEVRKSEEPITYNVWPSLLEDVLKLLNRRALSYGVLSHAILNDGPAVGLSECSRKQLWEFLKFALYHSLLHHATPSSHTFKALEIFFDSCGQGP